MNTDVVHGDRQLVTNARPTKFAHVVIATGRFVEMEHFYKTLLLAEHAFRNDFVSFLRYDDEHHRVVLTRREGFVDPPAGTNRVNHISFTYASLGALFGTYERLAGEGIAPAWCINHGLTTSIYYHDPDGMLVETQFDNMSVAEADAFMQGPYFRLNPIGVDFDPVLLKHRFEAGDPIEEIVRQGSAPFPDDVEPVRPSNHRPAGYDYDYRGKLLHTVGA